MDNPKALTWDELADLYNEAHFGRRAKTLPMDRVFEWAARQKNPRAKEGAIPVSPGTP